MAKFDSHSHTPYPEAEHPPEQSWLRRKLTQLGNNIGLNDLYRQQKDYYKLIEQIAPWIGPAFKKMADLRAKEDLDAAEQKRNLAADDRAQAFEKFKAEPTDASRNEALIKLGEEMQIRHEERKPLRNEYAAAQRIGNLKTGVLGDSVNFGLQATLSYFSSWWERNKVVSTYKELVQAELPAAREVNFGDLKRSKNPIVHEAAGYYNKKAWLRAMPDFLGLIRIIPLIAFSKKPSLMTDNSRTSSALWKIAEKMDGMNLLLGAKTMFFTWYAFARQTGSFYAAENLWNKTEGIRDLTNRTMNRNVLPGEFVRWQEIRSLYEALREEQPQMKMAEFTINDPLTSRIFEQVARYTNHTYMPKLFAVSSHNKFQQDLKDKKLTHAMLIDLMGTGGLRVQDAVPSAIRLEVVANAGKDGLKAAMTALRKVDTILQKIPRPSRTDYATQEEAGEALFVYFTKLESVAKEFLGDSWPPRYVDKEVIPGYISYYFDGKLPEPETFKRLNGAIANGGYRGEETMLSEAELDKVADRVAEKIMQRTQQLSPPPDKEETSWASRNTPPAAKIPEKSENFAAMAAANNNISLVK